MTEAKFNLVDEPWLKVITDGKGNTAEVSLRDLFQNAHEYVALGGEMETQNFAVLRFLLAIGHTVFSRVDETGACHEEYFPDGFNGEKTAGNRFQPTEHACVGEVVDYEEELLTTWENIWQAGRMPKAIEAYLDTWYDRFYLLDGEHPFYQVSHDFMQEKKPNLADPKKKTGRAYGKAINRVLTESENKTALFASKTTAEKDRLSFAEMARWLLTLHGYTGTGDKQVFRKNTTGETWSKGWLYDIGGLYAQGDNLFQTLMLNLMLVHPEEINQQNHKAPKNRMVKRSFFMPKIKRIRKGYENRLFSECLSKGFSGVCIFIHSMRINIKCGFYIAVS